MTAHISNQTSWAVIDRPYSPFSLARGVGLAETVPAIHDGEPAAGFDRRLDPIAFALRGLLEIGNHDRARRVRRAGSSRQPPRPGDCAQRIGRSFSLFRGVQHFHRSFGISGSRSAKSGDRLAEFTPVRVGKSEIGCGRVFLEI